MDHSARLSLGLWPRPGLGPPACASGPWGTMVRGTGLSPSGAATRGTSQPPTREDGEGEEGGEG